jgi:hypothetical protein
MILQYNPRNLFNISILVVLSLEILSLTFGVYFSASLIYECIYGTSAVECDFSLGILLFIYCTLLIVIDIFLIYYALTKNIKKLFIVSFLSVVVLLSHYVVDAGRANGIIGLSIVFWAVHGGLYAIISQLAVLIGYFIFIIFHVAFLLFCSINLVCRLIARIKERPSVQR